MKKAGYISIALILLLLSLLVNSAGSVARASADATTLPEGNDFATHVLRQPWDMSQFSEVSQYLNQSGQANLVQNINLSSDGVFSGESTSAKDAQFFVLWPGYQTAMLIGKVGHNYPIPSAQYKCLYAAMKVDSPATDYFQILYFADERLNGGGAPYGTVSTPISPGIWKLYRVDLSNPPTVGKAGSSWTSQTYWRGLRLDPTFLANTNFAVDWVRLTDCNSSPSLSLSWQGSGQFDVYVQPVGTSRVIYVDSVSGTSYSLRTEGLQAGSYTYLVKQGSTTVKSGSFSVNQAPIVNFLSPSSTSGQDYATQAGIPWNMNSMSEFSGIFDVSYSLSNGILDLVSKPNNDSRVELKTPKVFNGSDGYRYLTFRMSADGPYQNVPQGYIVRWIWRVSGSSPGTECYLVSQDIPFDVGWNTYTIDLYDSFNGLAEQETGSCGGLSTQWQGAKSIDLLRWDPNENELSTALHQQLDWIRLTKMDQVKTGQQFAIRLNANKDISGLNLSFYYTTDRSNPKQHPLTLSKPSSSSPPSSGHQIYLPTILNNFVAGLDGVKFLWNTNGVSANTYYVCVEASDAYNSGVYCSDTPVQVVN